MVVVTNLSPAVYLLMATRYGEVKKTAADNFAAVRSNGLIALDLAKGDELVGACLATVGLYLLSVTEALTFAPGDLWELSGAFFWAAHVLILSRLSPRMARIKLACAQYAVCALLSLIVAGFTETITLDGLRDAAIPILYGGILSVGVAYTLQVVAQRHAPPSHAAIILSLEAVFAALAGRFLLGEILSFRGLMGCTVMFAGMLTALLRS